METKQINIDKLKPLSFLTASQVIKLLGVSQPSLSRLITSGQLVRHAHDLYAHPDINVPPQDLDFAIACAKFGPKSTIGGLSALFYYGLIDQPPAQVWIVVSPQIRNHNTFYRTLRTKTSYKSGVDQTKFYRITNLERTLIEALKFSSKIGLKTVLGAVRKALQQGLTTEKKLGEMARDLKLRPIFEKYWDSVVL